MFGFEPEGRPEGPKTSGMIFRPPMPNPLLRRTVNLLLPWVFRYVLKDFTVEISPDSMEKLQAIRNERCLLLPNHPTAWDPYVTFELGRRLQEQLYHVAAREVFDYEHGRRGWLFQRLGVYSVVRGASDKASFLMTRKVLCENLGRLVIFVEGEISNQNDSLLPLEPGVVTLAYMALQDIYKKQGKSLETLPPLYVVPMAIKYMYDPVGLDHTIDNSLTTLEKALGLDKQSGTPFERIKFIGARVLTETARQFGYPLDSTLSWDVQLRGLEHFVLSKLEHVINLEPDPEMRYLSRVRRIRNVVDRIIKEPHEHLSFYQARLVQHQKDVLQNFYWDLDRVVNFLAIYDGYIHPDTLPERYVEVIRRLEKEVFGFYRLTHPRTAVVRVMDPINITPTFEAFLADKHQTLDNLIHQVEESLYEGLISVQPPARYVQKRAALV